MFAKAIKIVLIEVILNFLYFPIWWYTKGLLKAFINLKNSLQISNQYLGLSVWIKNWFKPMFGQYDWQGRIISFLMRTFQIIVRTLLILIWLLVSILFFILWVCAPIIVIYQIIHNLII